MAIVEAIWPRPTIVGRMVEGKSDLSPCELCFLYKGRSVGENDYRFGSEWAESNKDMCRLLDTRLRT